jgi:hypothetical protein
MTTLPATTLTVSAPATAAQGSSIVVSITGLEPGEIFSITISGTVLLTGTAPESGPTQVGVALGATAVGTQTLVATGQSADRTGSCPITIAKAKGGPVTETKRI